MKSLWSGLCLLCLSGVALGEPSLLLREKWQAEVSREPNVLLLDVRSEQEFQEGHIPGAQNIPHDLLPQQLSRLASYKDKKVVLYCRSGRRSAMAAEVLEKGGFSKLYHLEGDMNGWSAAGLPVESTRR